MQEVGSTTPSHCFRIRSMERQTPDLKSLAHSGGVGAFTITAREKRLNSPDWVSSLVSESQSKKDCGSNNTLQIPIIACLFLFS